MPKVQKIILILFLVIIPSALIVWIGYFVEKRNLTTNEVMLSNVLLVLFSIVVSTVVAHFYFESTNKRSLGTYAKKAAEKVSNLSNQLSKLSLYLQQDESEESLSAEEHLLIKEERIKGAVHIIETLKSVNDRSLSDWRGIVPDEDIEEAQQNIEEQADKFKQILDEYQGFLDPVSEKVDDESDEEIKEDISNIKKEIEKLATSIIGTPIKKKESIKKETVNKVCPNCGAPMTYKQRPMATSHKKLTCGACYEALVSVWDPVEGFTLNDDPSPISYALPTEITEDIIQHVKDALPDQPWPKGISKEIQKEAGLTSGAMKKIVRELIKRGDFKPQKNGILYEITGSIKKDSRSSQKSN